MKKSFTIVGAGLAGLCTTYQLIKASVVVDIYEVGPSVNGMVKTFPLWDQLINWVPIIVLLEL